MEQKKYALTPEPREVTGANPSDSIYFSVIIGNGQIGGGNYRIDGKPIYSGDLSQKRLIGVASELTSKTIIVETTIMGVNNSTKEGILTTTFTNDDGKVLFTKEDTGSIPSGGIASFTASYIIKPLLILLLISLGYANAQNSNDLSYKNLETPSSPGFILLDHTPSSIEKPTTPQGIALSLLGIQDNGGALESAPYWLVNHAGLTAEKLNRMRAPILQNLSLSISSIKNDTVTFLSAGIRMRLFQYSPKSRFDKLDSLRLQIIMELSRFGDKDTAALSKLRQAYVNITDKPVFTIDLAAAIAGHSSTNSYKDLESNRWAAWLAFSYRPQGGDFYVTALTRYINNEKYGSIKEKSDLMDLGSRLSYDFKRFSLSAEYLQRLNFTSKKYDDFRIAAIGTYKIFDEVFVTASFGKNFTSNNNIIALAGINFGFSKKKISAF